MAAIACEVTLAYAYYIWASEIYCDGSKTQLGAIITQMNNPLLHARKGLGL